MIQKHSYDTTKYWFLEMFRRIVIEYNIEKLHKLGGFENIGDQPGKDNNSYWHNIFYKRMRGSEFIRCYDLFMEEVIRPQYAEPIVAQRYPTLRIAIPGGKGVAAYHVDSDYNHPIEETNIWLPLTQALETNTIYIESEPGKKDYHPQNLSYGEYITFPGGVLSHGNEVSVQEFTRVSIDMRVIPISLWKPRKDLKGLAYGKVRDTEGEDSYYKIIE